MEKDPSEFEDSDLASTPASGTPITSGTPVRSGTPIPSEAVTDDPLGALGAEGPAGTADDKGSGSTDGPAAAAAAAAQKGSTNRLSVAGVLASNPDLSTEVKVKLRKLEKMEGRYSGGLAPPPLLKLTSIRYIYIVLKVGALSQPRYLYGPLVLLFYLPSWKVNADLQNC